MMLGGDLGAAIAMTDGAAIAVDAILAGASVPDTPDEVRDILRLLRDDHDHEACFSLVHHAEACPDAAYVEGVLSIADLPKAAPWWTDVLLRRIANHPSSRILLATITPPAAWQAAVTEALRV